MDESIVQKSGLPPGTLVHIGSKKMATATLYSIKYDGENLQEDMNTTVDKSIDRTQQHLQNWINLTGIHQVEVVEELGNKLGIHPLVLEDTVNTTQRPKLEDYEDYLYIIVKMLDYECEKGIIEEQVSFILDDKYLLTLQERAGDVFDPVRARLRNGKGKLRFSGTDYLCYALIDAIVDRYFLVMEKVGEQLEDIEEDLMSDPTPKTLEQIHELRAELLLLRRAVWPMREVINQITKEDSPLIDESSRIYFRDVYDHTIQVVDTIEIYREMITGFLDTYLSTISNRMNEVMKVLTLIATIFIPLTFIAGIYGMNFAYMPELDWRWGYPVVLFVMLGAGIAMYLYFKRHKWL
ncbi:MAG: magnesium/cobalt transporter CorA [Halanaerobium sp.]|nr:magnesium/cobalt transporter CorA [Halanaerobium sp.]